jgi:hypothetical protein
MNFPTTLALHASAGEQFPLPNRGLLRPNGLAMTKYIFNPLRLALEWRLYCLARKKPST